MPCRLIISEPSCILTAVSLDWEILCLSLCQTLFGCPPACRHLQTPPILCSHTSCPRLPPPGQCGAAPPCSKHWCLCLQTQKPTFRHQRTPAWERLINQRTYDDAHFTALVIKTAGHHGSHRVVHYCHDVCFIVLTRVKTPTSLKCTKCFWKQKKEGPKTSLTPRFLIALLSRLTTSIPSTPLALKLLVHVIR